MSDYSKYICKTASCPALGDWAIKNKLNIKWGYAKRGDLILFDFNHNGTSDHIGIVTKVGKDYIETIEGNTGSGSNTNGDGVYRRKRYKNQVNYFVRTKCPDIESVIRRAEAELGYKEGKNNSNKYGKWFGMNNVSWCCILMVYCFAHPKGKAKSQPKLPKPKGKYTGTIPKPTLQSGSAGSSVQLLQKFLNWYTVGSLKLDGDFGAKTKSALKKFQTSEGITADGIYGQNSYKKAKVYKMEQTKAEKLIAEAERVAWPLGTDEKKWSYKTGSPRDVCKALMKKRGYKTKVAYSDCGYFQNSLIYGALGKKVKVLGAVKKSFKAVDGFDIAIKGGPVSESLLKPGDIIRYKKKNGAQHVLMYVGDGCVCEAGRKTRFGVIRKTDKYNDTKSVKMNTLQVLRVKE